MDSENPMNAIHRQTSTRRALAKNLAVYAIGGITLAGLAAALLFRISFDEREKVLVWVIWCFPIVLLVPILRCNELNSCVASFLVAGSIVSGFVGAGINGPSIILGGIVSAWAFVLCLVSLIIWYLVSRFWLGRTTFRGQVGTEDRGESQFVSSNPYEPPHNT